MKKIIAYKLSDDSIIEDYDIAKELERDYIIKCQLYKLCENFIDCCSTATVADSLFDNREALISILTGNEKMT